MCFARDRQGYPYQCPNPNATHNDSPARVKTYDFIRMVSLRGDSQYLATCAKMTPWQRDCRMPSMRIGAPAGTSVWEASENTMAATWRRRAPVVVPLMLQFRFQTIRHDDQPETKYDEAFPQMRFQVMFPGPRHMHTPKESAGHLDVVRLADMPCRWGQGEKRCCVAIGEMSVRAL